MLEHKKLRVAVIGCGMIHVEHMQGYAELKDKVEIVAAVDRKSECLKEMHDRWGLPETALFADWKTMLAKVRPDAVDLCLPNYEHLPATLDAIAAGCHVYCEKPLGMNVAECEKMIAAAKAKNVKLAVGFQQEYCPSTEVLVNARNAGFFGDLRFVHGALLRRRGTPNWGTYYSRELGGGPTGCDLVLHTCGEIIVAEADHGAVPRTVVLQQDRTRRIRQIGDDVPDRPGLLGERGVDEARVREGLALRHVEPLVEQVGP